jgi:hypothetical protein
VLPPLDEPNRWWEWHTAVASLLLRQTYKADLAPAKKALALIGAFDQLQLAATAAERAQPPPKREY